MVKYSKMIEDLEAKFIYLFILYFTDIYMLMIISILTLVLILQILNACKYMIDLYVYSCIRFVHVQLQNCAKNQINANQDTFKTNQELVHSSSVS